MTPERVDSGNLARGCVGTRFAYYGGKYDGRVSTQPMMTEKEMPIIAAGCQAYGYTVTRYSVHLDADTLCWILFTHTPIVDREDEQ